MDHGTKAAELFLGGYNCSQAVLIAFGDVTGLQEDLAVRFASSFGGGMGRMREVCGAVSGMLMVAGILYGDNTVCNDEGKREHYAMVQELAGKFREQTGSIICREILKNPSSDPNPSPRTEQYYKIRPCAAMVMLAADIMDAYIREHPVCKD